MKFLALTVEVMSDSIEDRFKRDLFERYDTIDVISCVNKIKT